MLGKTFEESESEKAITYYKQVRELARHGFAESTGLAAASLGLEARVYLKQENYNLAIQGYLEQLATGDGSAACSLRFTAREALQKGGASLQTLAGDARSQKVITAYLISSRATDLDSSTKTATIVSWLEAIEASEVKDVASADQIALAAYQTGNMELAERWLKRGKRSPVSDWLEAKLLLRAGKVDQATALLSKVCYAFPIVEPDTNSPPANEFKDHVFVDDNDSDYGATPAPRHALGELGVLRLARREYAQSLDALLRAGFWGDAAYVAERILSLDELKNYVDQYWPAADDSQKIAEAATNVPSSDPIASSVTSPPLLRKNIRYLLARRLMRSIRGDEARPYYPTECLPQFDLLCQALTRGWDTSAATNQRAASLFAAAMIARTNGMELLGTEVQPDWHIHDGSYDCGVTWEERQKNSIGARLLKPTTDELQRASHHNADPEQRFHYRYQAAFLGWEAAKFLPNNSDETARVLCTAGSWLKDRDAETADIFYKSLVRRNRLTAVGAEADRRRWFPDIDENGNLYVPKPLEVESTSEPDPIPADGTVEVSEPVVLKSVPETSEPDALPAIAESSEPNTDETAPVVADTASGDEYIVQPGDTLTAIVRRYVEAGYPTSVEDIVEANPGLRPNIILIGQRIVVPVSQTTGS
jgi:LysM repeat protein